jgi:hypothetical protein
MREETENTTIRFYKQRDTYKGLKINPNYDLIPRRLESNYQLLNRAKAQYSDILLQHFTFKLPEERATEITLEEFKVIKAKFFKKLNKVWDKKKRGKLHYSWCFEKGIDKDNKEKNKNYHFHLFTLASGHRNKCLSIVMNKAWSLAAKIPLRKNTEVTGSVNWVCWDSNGKTKIYERRIEKNSDEYLEQLNEAFRWMSYNCKLKKNAELLGFATSR